MKSLDTAVIIVCLALTAGAYYAISFGILPVAPIVTRWHLSFFGFLGMVACMAVSPIASLLKGT